MKCTSQEISSVLAGRQVAACRPQSDLAVISTKWKALAGDDPANDVLRRLGHQLHSSMYLETPLPLPP